MINYKKSDKIRRAIENVQGNNAAFQKPVWINECTLSKEGHLVFWQYSPSKKHLCGINLLLCGVESIFILDFIIHSDTGKEI
jgi:hypothetical protein